MLIAYKKPTVEDFQVVIQQTKDWFEKNPSRNDCRVQMFGGLVIYKIRRNHIEEDMLAEYKKHS